MATATPEELTNPGDEQSPDDHRQMSLRFLDHADRELKARRRLQASEKTWGAITHQLSAIAEHRGWLHESHGQFLEIARYLEKEYGSEGLLDRVKLAEANHVNFYHNRQPSPEIRRNIEQARRLVDDLEGLRQQSPRPYTIENSTDAATVYRLTGRNYQGSIPVTEQRGFINEARLMERSSKWGQHPPDTPEGEGGGAPEARRQPPGGGAPPTVLVQGASLALRLDIGAADLLESPKPPSNDVLFLGATKVAERPKASLSKRRGHRAGGHRLPSGHRGR